MARANPTFLLSFDFDGTLVSHDDDPPFHPALGDLLRELRRHGVAWLINTGRSLAQTLEGLAQHNIFLLPDYIIAQECEIFRPGFFKPWRDFGSWNRRAHRAHDRFLTQHRALLEGFQQYVATETGAEFLMGDLGQIGIVAQDDAELDVICQNIAASAAQHPDLGYHRNGRYLRFSHAAFSKGTALQELARLLKLPPQRIFAAGDNYNDLSMLDTHIATCIACPSNALEPVKEHVAAQGGFVSTKRASEGMIQALEHFFSNRG